MALDTFLKKQTAKKVRAGDGEVEVGQAHEQDPPPVGCFSHQDAALQLRGLVLELVKRGGYYLTLGQMCIMLHWAIDHEFFEEGDCKNVGSVPTSDDADEAWNLLTALIMDNKYIQQDSAVEFFKQKLCGVDPQVVSRCAWRCITAYMAAISDWNSALTESWEDYSALVGIIPGVNWEPGRRLLAAIALHGPEYAASRASQLLAQLVAFQSRKVFPADEQRSLVVEEIGSWRGELLRAAEALLERVPNIWYDAPPAAVWKDGVSGGDQVLVIEKALRTAERALYYLNGLVQFGRGRCLPARFSHAASFRDMDAALDLQLQPFGPLLEAQQRPRTDGGDENRRPSAALRLSVVLPVNSYVGVLRVMAAEEASKAAGEDVSPSHFRLFLGVRCIWGLGFKVSRCCTRTIQFRV